MSYQNYRVQVGSLTISDAMIAKGSYSFVKERRVAGSWMDANGVSHEDYYPSGKAIIKFNLRQRSTADQVTYSGLFTVGNTVTVNYWDDYAQDYSSGTFRVKRPEMKHMSAVGSIFYDNTEIVLEEI